MKVPGAALDSTWTDVSSEGGPLGPVHVLFATCVHSSYPYYFGKQSLTQGCICQASTHKTEQLAFFLPQFLKCFRQNDCYKNPICMKRHFITYFYKTSDIV